MSFGPWEIGLIILLVLIVFGVGKLPQVGTAIGKTIHAFRKETHQNFSEDTSADSEEGKKEA